MKIKKGYGYWKIDKYPIGGDFHRATEDISITNIENIDSFKGVNTIGITEKGDKIAFNKEHTI